MSDNPTPQDFDKDFQIGYGKSWLTPKVKAIFHEMYATGDKNTALANLKEIFAPGGELEMASEMYQPICNTINSMDLKAAKKDDKKIECIVMNRPHA